MTTTDLGDMRKPYQNKGIVIEDHFQYKEPFSFFDAWFKELQNCKDVKYEEINAAALSTVSVKDSKPSCRMVLIKRYGPDGFVFYSSTNSRKGQEMAENPHVSLMFYWPAFNRSVRIEGSVSILSLEEADAYWARRPKDSQVSAFVSHQSSVVVSRQALKHKVAEVWKEFIDKDISIPRPKTWVGYIVKPENMEFWQGRSDRLHDRIRYRLRRPDEQQLSASTHEGVCGWLIERLSP